MECHDQAYKSALDICMRQVNDRINSFHSTINELTRSLEFTQSDLDELRSEVKVLQREKKEDKEKIQLLMEQLQIKTSVIKELEDKTTYLDDYNRRKNLQIVGVEEDNNESWEQTAVKVNKIVEEKLQLPKVDIERAHRVGLRRDNVSRPIVARFSRFCDREAILRNARKLRGTNIFINEDLSPASQAVKREQMPLLHQARREGKIAYFRYTKLIIRDQRATGPHGTGVGAARGDASEPVRTNAEVDRSDASTPASAGVARGGSSELLGSDAGLDRSGASGIVRASVGVDQGGETNLGKTVNTPVNNGSTHDADASSSVTGVGSAGVRGTTLEAAPSSDAAAAAAVVGGTGVPRDATPQVTNIRSTRSSKVGKQTQ